MLGRIPTSSSTAPPSAQSAPNSAAEPAAATAQRRRRGAVAAILTLAVITGFVAMMATWVRRQALDTGNWTNTSSRLLADPPIQRAIGAYLVNALFTNVDVTGELRNSLPTQLSGLAGPAAAGLRGLADRSAPELLARPRVQDAWRLANRNAHGQLIRILNGGGATVSTANGQVVLNLHSLVDQLASTLGVQGQVAAARAKLTPATRAKLRGAANQRLGVTLPPAAGQIVLMRADQLKTAQDVANAIKNLSILFTALSFGLFALAIWLARGWRRIALRSTGWCFFGLGVFVLLVRRVAGDSIVDALVRNESVRPAAHDAWTIGTSLLRAIALAFVIYGLVIVVAAWLAGSTRPALSARQALAPSLRDHPVRVYGAAALAYLLVIAWGPTPAFRHLIPVLIIAALLALSIELLRRQAAREFPDAHPGDGMDHLRAWVGRHRGGGLALKG